MATNNGRLIPIVFCSKSLKKYPTTNWPRPHATNNTNGQGHSLDARPTKLPRASAGSGLLIWVAAAALIKPNSGGKKPPPNSSKTTESKISPKAPCWRCTKAMDQAITNRLKSTARTPVSSKFGTRVMAGSQASQVWAGTHGGPMEANIRLAGGVLPCSISKKPCSSPATPATTPMEAATISVALLIVVSLSFSGLDIARKSGHDGQEKRSQRDDEQRPADVLFQRRVGHARHEPGNGDFERAQEQQRANCQSASP